MNEDACGNWQHPVEQITGFIPGQDAGYRCTLTPGHDGPHAADLDGEPLAVWE